MKNTNGNVMVLAAEPPTIVDQIDFDFSDLTAGDMLALTRGDLARSVAVLQKCETVYDGGDPADANTWMDLDVDTEYPRVIEALTAALKNVKATDVVADCDIDLKGLKVRDMDAFSRGDVAACAKILAARITRYDGGSISEEQLLEMPLFSEYRAIINALTDKLKARAKK